MLAPTTPRHDTPLRVAILADMREEGWPSMDLVADMLLRQLASPAGEIVPILVRPRLIAAPFGGDRPTTRVRVLNRFWLYRRALVGLARSADVFHIVDHSYAHLALYLPPARTVITCHDVDAFTENAGDSPGLPSFLNARLRAGLRRAAVVTCDSHVTRDALVSASLADAHRTIVVPNGVDECTIEDRRLREEAVRLLGPETDAPEILHVGSTIPRKRIDVLLQVFAALASVRPNVRLIRAGGPFTREQQELADRLGIAHRVMVMPPLERDALHALYRRAALVVSTSEREGFGLPVVEALAAGTPVVLTDIPVFREVAGPQGTYVPIGNTDAWRSAIVDLLDERGNQPDRWRERQAAARERSRLFTWTQYADRMSEVYGQLAAAPVRTPAEAPRRVVGPALQPRPDVPRGPLTLVTDALRGTGRPWTAADVEAAGGASAVLAAAHEQGVGALLWHVDRTAGILEPEIRAALTDEARAELTREMLRHAELRAVAQALAAGGCRALFFKGSALAYSHYPDAWMRPRLDTDLLVDREALPEVAAVLRARGYVESQALSSGELVSHQTAWEREDAGLHHVIDVHWRIANPQLFAHVLGLDDLWPASLPLVALERAARAPGDVHAFLLASIHRLAHHQGHERLVWLYDLHLLASGFDREAWGRLTADARRARLAAVCQDALVRIRETFGTPVPAGVLDSLEAAAPEPSRIYVEAHQDRIDVLRADLDALAWRDRLRLMREHLFPPVGFMLHRYRVRRRALLPALYAHRLVSGAYRWLTRMA